MAVVSEGSGTLMREYLEGVTKDRYPLTHEGDQDLRPAFGEALVRAAALERTVDNKNDAEAIAQYIADLPPTFLTQASQEDVRMMLILSQLSNEDLSSRNLKRDNITAALTLANTNFLDAQRLEYRAAIAQLSIF